MVYDATVTNVRATMDRPWSSPFPLDPAIGQENGPRIAPMPGSKFQLAAYPEAIVKIRGTINFVNNGNAGGPGNGNAPGTGRRTSTDSSDLVRLRLLIINSDDGTPFKLERIADYSPGAFPVGSSATISWDLTGLPAERDLSISVSVHTYNSYGGYTAPQGSNAPGGGTPPRQYYFPPNGIGSVTPASAGTAVATQKAPSGVTITSPPSGISLPFDPASTDGQFLLEWTTEDENIIPGPGNINGTAGHDDYSGFEVQYRSAPTVLDPNPAWVVGRATPSSFIRESPLGFFVLPPVHGDWQRRNTLIRGGAAPTDFGFQIPGPGSYQFRVRTRDWRIGPAVISGPTSVDYANLGVLSDWSLPITITWTAPYLPPLTLSPGYEQAVYVDADVEFSWQFRDPRTTGGTQNRREVQIREAGTTTWTEVILSAEQASTEQTFTWTGAESFLVAGKRYEWQARTRSTPGNHISTWSESSFFWAVPPANSGGVIPQPDLTVPAKGLGSGNNRAYIFDRGGVNERGELRNASKIVWHRKRDDMASATVRVDSWDDDYADWLGTLRSWQHEIVIFREANDETLRVWEGPITRITYGEDYVEFEAHDVMAYPYRRIMRQGYNDAYIHKTQSGLTRVTVRAASVLSNALAYDNPNVLQYMRPIINPDDARQSRVVPDFSSTAYEDVDDMAASAGLDYCVAGRSIILWDTHNELGRLPEMRNGDFDAPPLLTEYGMRMANVYAITNNNGVYGVANRLPTPGGDPVFGYIEMIDSAYGESDDGGIEQTLTAEARAKLVETLTGQADRAIGPRYPTPVVARVADNSRVMPHVVIGINQLIPGVYIPLRAGSRVRSISQMQKLDALTVDQRGEVESVRITMSPAPGFGGLDDGDGEEGGSGE